MEQVEQWRLVPGYEDRYEVSDQGHVRSLMWFARHASGVRAVPKRVASRPNERGYYKVTLTRNGNVDRRYVHQLVLEAFVRPRRDGEVTRHLNDIPGDNRLDNLRWGSQRENVADAHENGRRHYPRRATTHCVNGHEFTDDNVYLRTTQGPYGVNTSRMCRQCGRDRARAKNALNRKPTATHCHLGHLYDEANTYTWTNKQGKTTRQCRECRNFTQRARRSEAAS